MTGGTTSPPTQSTTPWAVLEVPRGKAAALLLGVVFSTGAVRAQDFSKHHLFTELGGKQVDYLGWSVAGAGDVDWDGYDDVIVGSDPQLPQVALPWPGFAQVYSGRTGLMLFHFEGDAAADRFGHSVSGAGDVDRDGFADLVVGAMQFGPNPLPPGYARVFSGRTGAVLWTFVGHTPTETFGRSVAGAGDVNHDGFDDVLIGIPGSDAAGANFGAVRVYSGEWITSMSQGTAPASSDVLCEANGSGGGFGSAVASVGFVDGDAIPDFAGGTPAAGGYIQVHSGADGALLWSVTNPSGDSSSFFGAALAGVGDVDQDGHDDLAVGAYLDDTQGTNTGTTWVFSGVNGSVLAVIFGNSTALASGAAVASAGDMNGDGHPDVAIGARSGGASNPSGVVRVISGEWIASSALGQLPATPQVLQYHQGTQSFDLFGTALGFAGDVNADRVPDLVVGANSYNSPGKADSGAAHMISGASLSLASMEHKVSLAAGGAQELALDAPDTRAGDFYVVLGSISGTKPGVLIGGLPLPLNPDTYTRVAASLANVPPFVSFAGVLDAEGDATARFELPPRMDPALAGLTLDHAFVTVSLLPFPAFTFASNPVPVSLVP